MPVKLPARSPDLNSFAERWVKSVKEECLSKLILFGEKSLRHALRTVAEIIWVWLFWNRENRPFSQ